MNKPFQVTLRNKLHLQSIPINCKTYQESIFILKFYQITGFDKIIIRLKLKMLVNTQELQPMTEKPVKIPDKYLAKRGA